MTKKKTRSDQTADLRRQAEELARAKAAQAPEDLETLSPEETRQMLHELRVHQIELEIQNEELRRAQAELEASRARYFDLYDLAPVGYFTVSEQGLIIEANLTAAGLLGVARGALVKQPLTRFILPEDQGIYYRHREQLFETRAPQVCEMRLAKKNGAQFWARLEATAVQDADGAPVCRAVMIDITERKRVEEELRESHEEKYRRLFELESDALFLIDNERGTICEVNRAAERLYGYSREELLRMKNTDVSAEAEKTERATQDGLNLVPLRWHRKKDGTRFPVEITATHFNWRGRPNHLAAIRDITERMRAEAALKEAAEKYRSLAASVDSMYLVDRDCTYLLMNEGHRLRFGLPLEEIVGRRYGEFHSEKNAREFAEYVREVCETGKPSIKEHKSERDGRCFLRTFTPIMGRSPAGGISEIVVVSKDITERKRAEQQLIETLQQLQETRDMLIQFEKHAAVGRLAAGVAHEILNPASIISSRLQFLEEENLSEPARENLKVSREQIQRIAKISHDLLQSSAKQPRPLVRDDLRHVIDVGLQIMECRIKEDHIHVEYNPPPEVIPVRMETDRMVKVIVNLILNACEAITGHKLKRLIVTVNRPEASSKNLSILLIVADNGHGIPAGDADRIFEPFFTTKDPGKGTGLGLSVCKGIIQEHGGTIHAENNDMGGASFIVELPLYYA